MRNLNTCLLISLMLLSVPAGAQITGVFTDPRDGQQYPAVIIGEQCWMAKNLNYADAIRSCYGDELKNCDQYGGLYTWEAAQEVCPAGWHIPSTEEWEALTSFLGIKEAGQKLKSTPEDSIPWDGTNETGFSALPAGAGNGEGFHRKGNWALFWSSTEYNDQRAWFTQLDGFWYEQPPKYKNLYMGWYYLKSNLFSVRCIKDQTE